MTEHARLERIENEVDTMKEILIRNTVAVETLANVVPSIHEIEIRLTKNESNWAIIKWLLGGSSGVGILVLILKLFGVI